MEAPGLRLRESFRVAVTGRARLLVGTASTPFDATVLDLSTTGMGLATAVAAPKVTAGEACVLELAIDGARIEGRGVVVWSRRARPDRGDAPNVGIRFERLEGIGEREISGLVEQRLVAGRWPTAAPPSAPAPSAAAVTSVTEQQLTMAVGAAPVVAPRPVAPTTDPAPSYPSPSDRAPQRPEVQPAAIESAAPRPPAPMPTPPATPVAPVDTFEEAPPKRRAILWVAIAAVALLVAIVGLLFFRGEDRSEPEAAAVESIEPVSREAEPVAAEPGAMVAPAPDTIADTGIAANVPPSDAERASDEPAAVEAPAAIADEPAPLASAPQAPAAALADPAAPSPARRLLALEPRVEGATEILALRFDAPLREADLFAALIGPDPPRYLLRLRGIERPWRPPELAVGSALMQRVRTGLHSTPRGPELHIVIDLTTRAVEHSWAIEGDALRVRLTPRAP